MPDSRQSTPSVIEVGPGVGDLEQLEKTGLSNLVTYERIVVPWKNRLSYRLEDWPVMRTGITNAVCTPDGTPGFGGVIFPVGSNSEALS